MIPRILHSDNYVSFIIIAHGRCGNDNVIIMLWFYVWFLAGLLIWVLNEPLIDLSQMFAEEFGDEFTPKLSAL